MSRYLIVVLLMLLVIGCTQSTKTNAPAPIPSPTPTAKEMLRAELCDAISVEPVLVDDLRRWITSEARISLWGEGHDYFYPTPGDYADDWMRGVQIWAWSHDKSTRPLSSQFIERWATINVAATGYLRATCKEGRDLWVTYSPDTSGCDVWLSELDRGTFDPSRILDGFHSKTSAAEKLPPRDLGFISLAYSQLLEIATDALFLYAEGEDDFDEMTTAYEMSINALEIASTLCGFEIPERLSRTGGE